MIEAELKARVRNVEAVQHWLRKRATEEPATYHDTYYDWPDHRLDHEGREIRLRTITTLTGTKHLLTYKQPPLDPESGSKPEHETVISDRNPVEVMLRDLGLVELVSLTKQCRNFRFNYRGRRILATLVTVPELDGTFLEVETASDQIDIEDALTVVRHILVDLDVITDLDSSSYTGSVLAARTERPG
ncbi:class IV adenylate cyclase [Glycomyces salinus]|uniref:class IV adenylate cyclase n=1 Tax=Glycomyces salinus TaxID=980294 RepID=UPI0018ECC73B|nr:CYTH domain-containing protein [Glycomyces salinus]